VSGDGGIPLRVGLRDGNHSDSVETPVAIEECLALGLEGVRGIVAESKAYSRRTLGGGSSTRSISSRSSRARVRSGRNSKRGGARNLPCPCW
jgi:hypothetical protein